jgi:anion-transporting  ArsA/GET3 family ATPase
MSPAPTPTPLDIDRVLDTAEIVVCCGAGGVGKTTTAAAVGLRAAERGRNVVVLTIDPARRLAQSMGLTELDNTPRHVAGLDESAGGRLDAMMLDMKRTFDEIVLTHADPARAEQIFANPFYQSLSSSFAGTQEYMAMEKLGQLKRQGGWDLIVVDTPPSRSALDFLDAPQRLGRFLDGRMIRLLLAPAKAGGRAYLKVVNVGLSMFTNVLTRIIGGQALKDLSLFVASLETMFGGFRERAEQTYQLLKAPGTQFLVVAAPERDALREAAYFVERLSEERMPLAGLVLNRVHAASALHLSADRSAAGAEELDEQGAHPIAAALLRLHADRVHTALRERRLRERFTSAHPHVPLVEVAAQADDVHDIDGLRRIAEELAAGRVDALPPEPPTPVKSRRKPASGSPAKPRRSSAPKAS